MREFIISTESNCDLPKDYIAENNICVIPHYYTVDDQVYGDDKELTCRQFYDEMRNLKKVGTMASNPAVIEERFTAIAREGKDILHISFSSALSGGCGNVVMTSKEVMEAFPEMTVTVVDTLSASLGEALLIMKAVEMKKEGKSLEETARVVEEMVPHLCILFTVDDLNYLYRGGRLSKTSTLKLCREIPSVPYYRSFLIPFTNLYQKSSYPTLKSSRKTYRLALNFLISSKYFCPKGLRAAPFLFR